MKIETAHSIMYGNYKHLKKRAYLATQICHFLTSKLKKEFRIDEKISILIRPIKGNVLGRAVYSKNRVEVDPRILELVSASSHDTVSQSNYAVVMKTKRMWAIRKLRAFVDTLAHEFTHFEQVGEGRLKRCAEYDESRRKWIDQWCGENVKPAFTFKQYLNLPWEVEARERADKFVQENKSDLDKLQQTLEQQTL